MQPQEIVEEEELERLNALLRRENLIRRLGIVEQITSIVQSGQQSQRKPPEGRVRGSAQRLSERGPGLSRHRWWRRPRRLMGWYLAVQAGKAVYAGP